MKQTKHVHQKWKIAIIVLLFICALTGARFLWLSMFHEGNGVAFENGELNIRELGAGEMEVLSLDGEWMFYPDTFIDVDRAPNLTEGKPIQVPGDWSDYTAGGNADGFGSYRLRILVDPASEETYSIRVPSVRSASALYVNGRLLAQEGEVGKSAESYRAENEPYSVYFTAENGVIDLVIHVANFDDPRGGGLIRSIKFGTEEMVSSQTTLSTTLQLIVSVILLMHSVFALILYVLGDRDKRIVYFSLFIFSYMLSLALGSEEKLIHLWFPISYTFGFKLITLLGVVMAYAILKCLEDNLSSFWQNVTEHSRYVVYGSVLLILVLPLKTMLTIQPIFALMMAIAVSVASVTIFTFSLKHVRSHLLLLLSLLAFVSNFLWWGIFMLSGIKVIYYPFDLIIAVVLLAAYWFQHYFALHREAKRISAKLEEADKEKDSFLANTSHELRNPLHAILNMSHTVLEREKLELERESVKDLETILSVGRRMSKVLDDLLDVVALKEQRVVLHHKTFPVQSIAHGVLDMLYYMTEGKPLRLVNQIPEDFPPVYADEDRIIQVLFNLVHNSVKYTNEGTISIDGYVEQNRAYIVVTDTGIGMNQTELQTIFDPYEQGTGQESMIEGGFGLGLSISRQLVELHEGELRVQSTHGTGSTFTFSLPLSSDAYEEHVEEEIAAINEGALITEEVDTKLSANRPRILVVDDDPVNLHVVQTVLSTENYDMTLVRSGEQALEKLHKKEWDLVISDVMMPRMSGYALTREIRKKFTVTELPILLLTARNQMNDIENGFLSGANDYVAKPVDALELQARVQALTSLRQTMREHLHMEAAWLQAQIQPHFLFNALNTIIALSEIDPVRMRATLEAFSIFLRGKFRFQHMNDLVAIEEEIELVETYLYIEKERFGDRLQVVWDIEEETKHVHIPSLTIQPLVENAIHHGIMSRIEGGMITVRVHKKDAYVNVTIEDDGVGIEEDYLAHIFVRKPGSASGVGLINTNLRLQRQHGKGLIIDSAVGNGTTISFLIPLEEEIGE